jgi:hypothetical protein
MGSVLIMMSQELAYLAGVIDGEGNIAIGLRSRGAKGEKSPIYWGYLKVSNTDRRLLEWCANVTGVGTIHKEGRKRGRRRQLYIWHVSSTPSEQILRDVYPYLVIKREQAEAFFEFRATFLSNQCCRNGTPPLVTARRRKLYEDMQTMHAVSPA